MMGIPPQSASALWTLSKALRGAHLSNGGLKRLFVDSHYWVGGLPIINSWTADNKFVDHRGLDRGLAISCVDQVGIQNLL